MTMEQNRGAMFQGWRTVVTSATGLFFGVPIIVYTFSIFLKPFMHDFHTGRAAVSAAYTLQSFIAAICAPIAGWLVDLCGARRVILPSMGTFAAVLILNKWLTGSLWQLFLFYACLGALLNGVGPIPYSKVVSQWFDTRRGLALGLTMLGVGAGAIILPPVAQALITRFEWHIAFSILGAAVLLIPLPIVAIFLSEVPGKRQPLPDKLPQPSSSHSECSSAAGMSTREATHTRSFWLMLSTFFLIGATAQACIVHMAAMIADRGATAQVAALGISVIGTAVLISRAITGYLLDRVFAPVVACVVFGLVGMGIILLLAEDSVSLAFTSAFLIGLGLGAEVDIIPFLISRYFGLRSFGKLFSVAFGIFVLAGALGPLAMGAGFDLTGGYRTPLAALLGAACAATLLITRLGPYRYSAPHAASAGPAITLVTGHVRSEANSA